MDHAFDREKFNWPSKETQIVQMYRVYRNSEFFQNSNLCRLLYHFE
jgi:hypothetical protein